MPADSRPPSLPQSGPAQCAWTDYGQRCQRDGTHSDGLTGEGPWWCREHDARRRGRQPLALGAYEPEDLSRVGLPARTDDEPPRAYAKRCAVAMQAGLAKLAAPKLGRQRDWATRILDRYADGDPRISSYAMRIACEALGQDPEAVAASVARPGREAA